MDTLALSNLKLGPPTRPNPGLVHFTNGGVGGMRLRIAGARRYIATECIFHCRPRDIILSIEIRNPSPEDIEAAEVKPAQA